MNIQVAFFSLIRTIGTPLGIHSKCGHSQQVLRVLFIPSTVLISIKRKTKLAINTYSLIFWLSLSTQSLCSLLNDPLAQALGEGHRFAQEFTCLDLHLETEVCTLSAKKKWINCTTMWPRVNLYSQVWLMLFSCSPSLSFSILAANAVPSHFLGACVYEKAYINNLI